MHPSVFLLHFNALIANLTRGFAELALLIFKMCSET